MAEYTLPLVAEGAVTLPSGVLAVVEPSAESETFHDVGPVNVLEVPEMGGSRQFGWVLADGVNPLRLVTRGGVYDAGGLAPAAAPTLGVTGGVKASIVGTWVGQPANLDTVTLGLPGRTTQAVIQFRTVLVMDGTAGSHVLIGATDDESYENLQAYINGTGTQGVEYFDYYAYKGYADWRPGANFTVSAIDTAVDTITFQYSEYGTVGNSCECLDSLTNFTFAGAAVLFTGGTDGTGEGPAAGSYRYFTSFYRDADGAETGRSPIATIDKTTNADVTVTIPAASADTTYDYVRIYRTAIGGVEFFLVGSTPRATLSYNDSAEDDDLAGDAWNYLNYRAYAQGMPPRGRALAYWNGSVWTIGAHLAADHTAGNVAVNNDSATITFTIPCVSELMVGRTFQVDDTSEEYTILSVSEAAGTAVIDREYTGATNGGTTYKIRDNYDACRLRASVAFKPNQWPVDNSPGRVDTDDAMGGTALLATESRLFAFTKTSITALTGDDATSWQLDKIADGIGCPSPRMVVSVSGGGVFLAMDGFYTISPDGSMQCISSPPAPKGSLATGIDRTVARISWANIDQGYSIYDREERIVIFGVPLDGATTVNYEIIFDVQNLTWTLYKRAEWTAAERATLPDGSQGIISGDRHGSLWHAGIGESDGFYGTEAVQTLTGTPTVRTLGVAGTPFTATGDGEEGKPVLILYADKTTVAYGKVASNTTSVLTLCEDLDTAPAAGDQIVLGGIAWQAKSGFTTFGEEYRQKNLRSITLRHSPTTRGDYHLSFAADSGAFQLCPVGDSIGDLTDTDGKEKHMVQWPGDTHAINVRGFKPGGRAVLRGGIFDVIMREMGRV